MSSKRRSGSGRAGRPASGKQGSARPARAAAAKARRGSKRGWSPLHWSALALLTVLGLLAWRAAPGSGTGTGLPARVGAHAPDLSVKTLDGDRVSLEQLRGKVVLVNFWATWCPPCRAEMPGFERVWRERGKDGFVVVGLSEDEGAGGDVAAFLQQHGITYPVAMATASARRAFGGVSALPASFLVDRKGVVRRTITGEFEERLLQQDVNRLLQE